MTRFCRQFLFLGTAVLLPLNLAWAKGDAGLPGSFLRQGIGARAQGMGGAFTAVTDDATAIYWNPAGLTLITKPELSATQTILFEDTNHAFAGFAYPTKKWGTWGIAYIRQSSGEFEKRVNPFDSPTTFSISQSALEAGWGIGIPWKFPVEAGVVLKSVYHAVDTFSDSGFGADAGISIRPLRGLRFGLLLQNVIAPEITLVSRPVKYPMGVDFSPAYTHQIQEDFQVTVAGRLSKYGSRSFKPSGGMELWYQELAAARFGVQEKGISTGFGLKWGNYRLDYAVLFHELAPVHNMSLALRFGHTMKELQAQIKKGIKRFNRQDARRLARTYVLRAEMLLKQKNYRQAVSMLENAALWAPENAEIGKKLSNAKREMNRNIQRQIVERSILLAIRYYESGDLLTSREYWQAVTEMDPADSVAKEYLEKIDRQMGNREKERLNELLKITVEKRFTQILAYATTLLEQKKFIRAIQEARKALKILPDDSKAISLISIARQGLGVSIDSRWQQGLKLFQEKRFSKALGFFESILKDDPEHGKAAEKLAASKAALAAVISPETRKKVEKLYYMAVDAYLKGSYDKTGQLIEQILGLDPLNESARNLSEKVRKAAKVSG